jgi:hypothetical protein
MVVLEERELAEDGGASAPEPERVGVLLQPVLHQVERELVFSEAHLDDAAGVGDGVEGVLLVLLPAQEVGRVLAVAVASGLLRQQLRLVGDLVHHLNLSPPPGQLTRRARACLRSV